PTARRSPSRGLPGMLARAAVGNLVAGSCDFNLLGRARGSASGPARGRRPPSGLGGLGLQPIGWGNDFRRLPDSSPGTGPAGGARALPARAAAASPTKNE